MLRKYISRRASAKHDAERKSGLLFCSRNGKPLYRSSVLRRKLHPVLVQLGQPKCGVHAFRRFRNTYLGKFTSTPPGLTKFWMGHAGEERTIEATLSSLRTPITADRLLTVQRIFKLAQKGALSVPYAKSRGERSTAEKCAFEPRDRWRQSQHPRQD